MWVETENAGAVRCRVLVVEDDPSSRRALTLLLQLKGFELTVAGNVAEALRQLEWNPTCVLLDLMLPDGNGAVVLQHIRTRRLPIRVAVTTGASNWEALLDPLQPDALFPKPLDFNRVVDWLSHSGSPDSETFPRDQASET